MHGNTYMSGQIFGQTPKLSIPKFSGLSQLGENYGSDGSFKGLFQQQYFDHGDLNMMKPTDYVVNYQNIHSVVFPSTLGEIAESSFSKLQIPQVQQITPEISNIFHSMDVRVLSSTNKNEQHHQQPYQHLQQPYQHLQQPYQDLQQPHQPCVMFEKPSSEAQCYVIGKNESCTPKVGQTVHKQSQLPSEQSHWVQFAPESSQLSSSLRGTARDANSSNSSQYYNFHSAHRALLTYITFKTSMKPVGDCKVSFMKFLHSKMCKGLNCKCKRIWLLISHFEDCHHSDCPICGHVRNPCFTGQFDQKFKNAKIGLLRHSNKRNSSGPCSGSSKEMLHPLKRMKMENSSCPLSPESGISCMLTPLKVQPCYLENFPALQQRPKSPVSINSEVMGVNTELLTNPIKDSSFGYVAENSSVMNAESVPTPSEDIIVSHKPEELGIRSMSETADHFLDDSNGLMFNTVPTLSEELGASCKEELLVKTKFDLAKPETENEFIAPDADCQNEEMDIRSTSEIALADNIVDDSESLTFNAGPILSEELNAGCKEELLVKTKFDLAKPETENEFIAPEADCQEEIKSKNPKIRGVSLIEYFTAEQIKEHTSSLRQHVGQSIHTVSENSCQLCGGDKLPLAPAPLYCSSCGARIKRSVNYFRSPEENGMRHCFCTSCYKESRGGSIMLYGIAFPKAQLDKVKNDEATEESWVQCDKCEGWLHQICALFNDERDMEGKAEYMCSKCCLKEIENGERVPLPKSAVFVAKDLPRTELSNHIEQRLFRRLHQERQETAKVAGKNLDEVPRAEDLVVRVVSSVDKHLKVKKQFLDIFQDQNYPAEFPYKSKVILLFQKIDGVDVCLFGMYVQEFGSECGHPNDRCIYISYLDSVKYFRPETETSTGEALRTFVYHEILIGYLEYCKKRGFATCYLWACPPLKGEDYILYCHPENQKTPKSDKLRQWYRSMLRKAAKEKIVVNFTNLYDHFFVHTGQCNSKVTAARLPYFDGDYWSGAAENVIKNIEQESGEESQRKLTKQVTKRTLKAMGHTNPSGGATKDILLMQKLGQTILPVKEDFMIVHLQFVCTHCHEVILSGWRWFCGQCKNFQLCERCHDAEKNLNGGDTHTSNSGNNHLLFKVMVDDVPSDTKDKDAIIDTGLFENRNTFLSFCQKNHHQFDTLRRAKHSSMMILHHLRNTAVLTAGNTCSICHKDTVMDQCWLCEICPEFNVCATCYHEKGTSLHVHRLTQHSSAAYYGTESKEVQQKAFQTSELLDVLEHASQCDATKMNPCSYPNCLQIKKLYSHAKNCLIRARGGCELCKKAWLSLCLHARKCTKSDCCVPRCNDLKQHSQRVRLQSENRQRVAAQLFRQQQVPEVA